MKAFNVIDLIAALQEAATRLECVSDLTLANPVDSAPPGADVDSWTDGYEKAMAKVNAALDGRKRR
ncbi:MAG TPA: hypothetical protein VHR97_11225 [Candidatus Baltobacteraceae bacterium]|jgi:hypothetical protein|nr:hypothetical protein [Candidatus Baltobacteraceae bacterium]